MAAAFLYAGYEGLHGGLQPNQFASFVGAMLLAQQPVRNLSQLWTVTTEGLAAATRIELRGTLLRPAWAVGDAGNLAAFPVMPDVESLTILVDNDESGTGQQAALECSSRWTTAGREVFRIIPDRCGDDLNDIANRAVT